MKSSFDCPFDVITGVLATLLVRGILFAAAIVVGLNVASLVRQGTFAGKGEITFAIAITAVGWMFSLHLLAVCLISVVTIMVLVISESRLTVGGWLGATCVAWCSTGLWLGSFHGN